MSIKEFRQLRFQIEQISIECYQRHRQASGDWKEGDIAKVWIDGQGILCIEYESGNWWHYNDEEWW